MWAHMYMCWSDNTVDASLLCGHTCFCGFVGMMAPAHHCQGTILGDRALTVPPIRFVGFGGDPPIQAW